MKRILMLLALSVFTLTLSIATAAGPANMIHVRLAQPTVVGETTLPAGDYTVQVMRSTGDTPILLFQSKEKSAMVLANQTDSGLKNTNSELVLAKTGEQFKLQRVIVDGQTFDVLQ